MAARKNRPGKCGTPVQEETSFKNKPQRAAETSFKEAFARWLWEAERRRPNSWHSVPLGHIDGARLLKEAGYIELQPLHDAPAASNSLMCHLNPSFKTWWCGYA